MKKGKSRGLDHYEHKVQNFLEDELATPSIFGRYRDYEI